MLAVLLENNEVRLLDATTLQSTEKSFNGDAFVVAPDGKFIACRSRDGRSYTLYDLETRKPISAATVTNTSVQFFFSCAAVSRNACLFACVETSKTAAEETIHLLDVKTGCETAVLKVPRVTALAFAANDKLVFAGEDKIIRLWDTRKGKELYQLGDMKQKPRFVNVLPDGKTILSACAGQVCFWDAASGKEARPALTCEGLLCPAALSSDGTKLIERVGNAISIWSLATGQETGPTAGACRSLMGSFTFSPDSKKLVTVTEPEKYRAKEGFEIELWQGRAAFQFWDAHTGKRLSSLPIPSDMPVKSLGKIAWPLPGTLIADAACGATDMGLQVILRWSKVSTNQNSCIKPYVYSDCTDFSQDGQVSIHLQDQNLELIDVSTNKQ